jgi:hypothetical protein
MAAATIGMLLLPLLLLPDTSTSFTHQLSAADVIYTS